MEADQPFILLVTGIMASGKSTVAQLLAERLDKSVHVRGDLFRRMIVNGRNDAHPNMSQGAREQLLLRYRLAARTADMYREAGFHVIVQDVVLGRELTDFISFVRGRPLYVVVLCPSARVVENREAGRSKKGYGSWSVSDLDDALRETTPRIGMWLDSSDLSPEETVSAILRRFRQDALIDI